MTQQLFVTDGGKAVNLLHSDDPEVWNYFTGRKQAGDEELYSRVAAVYRMVNRKSEMVSAIPFVLMRGDEEIDASDNWQNVVGWLPNPFDLFRRVSHSLSMTNMAYAIMGKNLFGYPKSLNYVKVDSIGINTDVNTGRLISLDRMVGGRVEKSYKPDDTDLVRWWWLDNNTELVPTPYSEFRAALNAAGIIFWGDTFTKNYFQRGGVKPTLIAMKGLINKDQTGEMQRDWSNFVARIGQGAKNIAAKIFNAEAMSIQPFGEGLGDLKETPVFRKALEDIAIAFGMSLSSLLSNSSNYATATVEERRDYRTVIVPRFDFIARVMNDSILKREGLRIENRAEATDAEQEDEVQRASAVSTFMDFLVKCPTAEIALETCNTFGYELTEGLINAITSYFKDKEKEQEKEPPATIQSAPPQEPVEEEEMEMEEEEMPKAWQPTNPERDELRIWREVALRRFKRAESLDFTYEPHRGGLPDGVSKSIHGALKSADSIAAIEKAFDEKRLGVGVVKEAGEITILAEAMNRLAETMAKNEPPVS